MVTLLSYNTFLGSGFFICKMERNNTLPACLTEQVAPTHDIMGVTSLVKLDEGSTSVRNKVSSLSSITTYFTLPISKIHSIFNITFIGVSNDWYATLDMLKESCRIASSVNWSDVDLSQFQGKYWFFLTYNQIHILVSLGD